MDKKQRTTNRNHEDCMKTESFMVPIFLLDIYLIGVYSIYVMREKRGREWERDKE